MSGRIGTQHGQPEGLKGVKATVDEAVRSVNDAYFKYSKVSLNKRQEVIAGIRKRLSKSIADFAMGSLRETGVGNVKDKIAKIVVALYKTPDVDDMVTEVKTGDQGMILYELSPYGVVCGVHPHTNPCATLINNTICALAAGNGIIHIPHPRAKNISKVLVREIAAAVEETCGISDLVVTLDTFSQDEAAEIMSHPDVDLVVATGSNGLISKTFGLEKRVIRSGPANPVVIVDETADFTKAARDIIAGASFDHNIMCITEKNIVVTQAGMSPLVAALEAEGAFYIDDDGRMLELTRTLLNNDLKLDIRLEGKSAPEILKAAGLGFSGEPPVIILNTNKRHPFVAEELLVPVVPLIAVADFDEALETALFIEAGNRHTGIIHSQSIKHLNRAAAALQTALFVKNGSSLSGIGFGAEGEAVFSIANSSGEGVITPRHMARRRKCVMMDAFSIR